MKIITNCPQCQASKLNYLYSKKIDQHFYEWRDVLELNSLSVFEFKIFNCQQCGLTFRDARFTSEELSLLYGGNQSPNKKVVDRQNFWGRSRELDDFFLKNMGIKIEKLKILDVGGGSGELCDWFAEVRGCECDVFEFDCVPAQIKIRVNLIGELPADKPYDLIMLNHVLEHVNEPVPFLSQFSKCADANTLFYLEVPYELFHYHLLKTMGHYEHINYFGETSVINLIRLANLNPLFISLKMGFGNSIPVVCAIFKRDTNNHDAINAAEVSFMEFNVFREVFNIKVFWLMLFSKMKIKMGFVDKSHRLG